MWKGHDAIKPRLYCGSATNDNIGTSSSGLMLKDSARTFIKSTALATTITTPSVTTDLSTVGGGGGGGPGGARGAGGIGGAGGARGTKGAGGGPVQPPGTRFQGGPTGTSTAPTRTTTKSLPAAATFDTATSREPNHQDFGPPAPGDSGEYLNITSQAGTHAYLPCNVKQLVKKPVSWIRVRDGHILTVDQTTFIADQRFQSIYTQNPEERWSLQIKYVQTRDAGSYECQVSTEPKMSARVWLQIVEPKTELLGETNRHVKAGSRVVLRCVVTGALEPPLFINWYFDKKQIFLHNHRGWRTEMDREASAGNHSDKQNTIASLIIPAVTKKDSGNYTCSPSNSESITVVLHVLNGKLISNSFDSTPMHTYKGAFVTIISPHASSHRGVFGIRNHIRESGPAAASLPSTPDCPNYFRDAGDLHENMTTSSMVVRSILKDCSKKEFTEEDPQTRCFSHNFEIRPYRGGRCRHHNIGIAMHRPPTPSISPHPARKGRFCT